MGRGDRGERKALSIAMMTKEINLVNTQLSVLELKKKSNSDSMSHVF